jgi:hypothetical protein
VAGCVDSFIERVPRRCHLSTVQRTRASRYRASTWYPLDISANTSETAHVAKLEVSGWLERRFPWAPCCFASGLLL